MLKTVLSAFATFLATIGPVEAAVLFACPRFSCAERVATGIATGIRTSGGIILLIIALDMRGFGRRSVNLAGRREETKAGLIAAGTGAATVNDGFA